MIHSLFQEGSSQLGEKDLKDLRHLCEVAKPGNGIFIDWPPFHIYSFALVYFSKGNVKDCALDVVLFLLYISANALIPFFSASVLLENGDYC